VTAAQRTPIRITHMTNEYSYGRTIRETALELGLEQQIGVEIPFPGLPQPGSQLAVPIVVTGRLLGVLHVESPDDNRFTYDHEDVLVALATQLGLSMALLGQNAETIEPELRPVRTPQVGSERLQVRHYAANDSIFLGDAYLIKGVAGAIFWRLLQEYQSSQRTDFCNRELRLDPSLRLPDIDDNLEARLILLARRLTERSRTIAITKTGRGRFRLDVSCLLE